MGVGRNNPNRCVFARKIFCGWKYIKDSHPQTILLTRSHLYLNLPVFVRSGAMQTVCKKVMLSQGDLVRRVLASGSQAAIMVGDTRPVRLMDRMLDMYGVCNDDSLGVWADLTNMRQCKQCGHLHERCSENTNMPVADCCGLMHYCDRECQGDHAAEHKTQCEGRFKWPFYISSSLKTAMPALNCHTLDEVYLLSDINCKARREIKIANVCACALNYMQKLSTLHALIPPVDRVQRILQFAYYSKFPEWWKRQMLDADGRGTSKSFVFVATFNDRLGCLSFMQLTLEEMYCLFNPDERCQVQEALMGMQFQMDKKERAVLAVAFKDHGSRKGHFRILPLYIPNRIDNMQLALAEFRNGPMFSSMPDHVKVRHRWS